VARVLETILTGRDLLSPVLAKANGSVSAYTTAVTASNAKAASSATTSAVQQTRAHTQAAQSATLAARSQQAANNALARSNAMLGTSLTPLTAGLGAVGLGLAYAGYRGMEFDSAMSQVQAATMETAGNMDRLRDAATEAGARTQYSSVEAAQGITELAKAGVQTTDIINGGLNGALDLAAAGQMEVADAAEIGATALNVFNLEGDQMSHVADLLAAGAGKAQGSVHDLGMALNQSALVAAQTGLSIEDTTGALAAFASQGLIGSDAGTSFRSMLLHLQNPSNESADIMERLGIALYDTNGEFVGLQNLAGQLQTRLSGLTQAQRDQAMAQIFGSDAVRAANVLYEQGAEGIADWTAKVNDAGYAQEQATRLTDNLRGDLERLGGAFDSVVTTIGGAGQGALRELVQLLTAVVSGVGWAVEAFSDLPGPVQATVTVLGALLLLNGPLKGLLGSLQSVGQTAALRFMYARDAVAGLGTAAGAARAGAAGFVGMLGGPWGLAIAGATLGLSALVSWLGDTGEATDDTTLATQDYEAALRSANGVIDESVRRAAAKVAQDEGLLDVAKQMGIPLGQVTDAILNQGNAYNEVAAKAVAYRDARVYGSEADKLAAADANNFLDVLGLLSEQTDATIVDEQQLTEATAATGDALAGTVGQTEEAIAALEAWREELQTVASSFVDPLATYKGLLEEKTAAEREAAQNTADETEKASDSWEDYVDDVDVSLDELAKRLQEQLTNQENWRDNLAKIAQWAGADVAQHLAAMGQDGVEIVAKMADGTTAGAKAMREQILREIKLGGAEWTAEMDTRMQVMARIGRDGSARTVQEVARELGLGVREVRRIAREYGVELASGVNPLLRGLGKPAINYSAQYGSGNSWGAGGRADGGFIDGWSPHPRADNILVRMTAGEHVQPVRRVHQYGGDLFEAFRAGAIDVNAARALLPGRADGGFVSTSDVPRPPSTSPYRPPISTPGTATMGRAYGDTVDWVEANAFPPAGSLAAPGRYRAMFAAVRAAFPDVVLHSGFRPGSITATGNLSYHALGRAIDISPRMDIFNWLLSRYGATSRELIFSPAGARQRWNGRPHLYSEPTRGDHWDHIHWAMYRGGVIGEPVSGRGLWTGGSYSFGERGPETVLPGAPPPPTAMPGYGLPSSGMGGTVVVVEKRTQIQVDAQGQGADVIAARISQQQAIDEWLNS
jgi:TP901 family phage tail tape measure protein